MQICGRFCDAAGARPSLPDGAGLPPKTGGNPSRRAFEPVTVRNKMGRNVYYILVAMGAAELV